MPLMASFLIVRFRIHLRISDRRMGATCPLNLYIFLFIFMTLYQNMTQSGMRRVEHDFLKLKFKISVLNALENPLLQSN